mmetsp:Transcript_25640/g.31576  ORF Transcript_25640/g.31576 Transcript_25640/m.31576 type:complete len:234 (+) Transcript_25640:106-807(+)
MATTSSSSSSSSTKMSNGSNILSNMIVAILSMVAALILSTVVPSNITKNSNDPSSSFQHSRSQFGNSLSHLVFPHPLNLTWHLNGPTLTGSEHKSASNNVVSATHDDGDHNHKHDDDNNKEHSLDHDSINDNDDIDSHKDHGSPLVTIHDILPHKIVSKIIKELKSSTRVVRHPNGQMEHQCILRRDGLACGNERWVDFDVNRLLQQHQENNNNDNESKIQTKNELAATPRYI